MASRARVPTTAQVIPGASVNIVLKADQPTGRTVSGTVRDLLTRGNHPRGIKVRLSDGRVGRVQTMAAVAAPGAVAESASAAAPEAVGGSAFPAPDFEESGRRDFHRDRPGQDRGHGREQDQEPEPPALGLDAYIKQGKQPRRRGKQPAPAGSDTPDTARAASLSGASVTCPVCGAFEGDEAAVAHHVATHFDQ